MTLPEQGGFGADIGGSMDVSFGMPDAPNIEGAPLTDDVQERPGPPVRTTAQLLLWARVLSDVVRRAGYGEPPLVTSDTDQTNE